MICKYKYNPQIILIWGLYFYSFYAITESDPCKNPSIERRKEIPMKTNKKRTVVRFAVFAVLLVVIFSLGLATGLIKKGIFRSLHLNLPVILKLLVMIFGVLMLEAMISLILSLPHPKSHRVRSILSIVSSVLKYVAAIVILCWGLSILGVNVSTIVASVGIVALILQYSF